MAEATEQKVKDIIVEQLGVDASQKQRNLSMI